MRFKNFIENLWGTTPSPNPPSQPYWLKGSGGSAPMMGSGSPMGGAVPAIPQQGQPQKKMMKKKMKKD